MKRLLLVLFLLFATNCYAKDYWVYVRTYDRSGVTQDDDKGRSKKGDIVAILPCTPQYTPSETEKKSYLILKTSDLTDAEKENLVAPMLDEKSTEEIKPEIAYRKNKLDIPMLDIATSIGEHKDTLQKTRIINSLSAKTVIDLAHYEQKRFIYLALQRPFEKLARLILPYAYASTVVTKINCVDENYNTIALWEDDTDNDLVTAQQIQEGDMYDDQGELSTVGATMAGATTSTGYYRILTAPVGERHNGTFDGGGAAIANDGNNASACIAINENYFRLEWLRVSGNAYSSARNLIESINSNVEVVARFLMIDPSVNTHGSYQMHGIKFQSSTGGTHYVFDCIANGIEGYAFYGLTSATADHVYFYNCTSYNTGWTGFYATGAGAASVYWKNCLALGTGNGFSGGTQTTCGSDDATASSFPNLTAADELTDVSVGTEDFHLKAGATSIDTGTDLGTGLFSFDIDNRDRDALGDTWDLGADEYVAVAVAAVKSQIITILGW